MTDPILKVCDLYAKTSRGPGERQYLVGYLGGVKVLIFRVNNTTEHGPTHTLHFVPRPAAIGSAIVRAAAAVRWRWCARRRRSWDRATHRRADPAGRR